MRFFGMFWSKAATVLGLSALLATGLAGPAQAAKPEPWGIGMQPSNSIIMDDVNGFHDFLLYIIFAISIFVLALLVWVMIRYRESANPEPSKTTHNTLIEILWTTIPVVILVVIAVPSFRLLYFQDNAGHELPITIKAKGIQWRWQYEYLSSQKLNDQGRAVNEGGTVLKWDEDTAKYTNGKPVEMLKTRFSFVSRMLCKTDAECATAKAKRKMTRDPVRLLDVNRELVIPVGVKIRLLVDARDVIHAFAMPSMGIKVDAVPGRVNETWMQAKRTGLYYGQCSEICGRDHAYMPIAIRVVTVPEYQKWLAETQAKAASGADKDPEGYQKIETLTPAKTSSRQPARPAKRAVATNTEK